MSTVLPSHAGQVAPSQVHKPLTPQPPQPATLDPNALSTLLKDRLLPVVIDQLSNVRVGFVVTQFFLPSQIDKMEDSIPGSKIDFGIEDLSVEKTVLPKEHTHVNVDENLISLEMYVATCCQVVNLARSQIELVLHKFKWHFKKHSLPKIKSSGTATCNIRNMDIKIVLALPGPQQDASPSAIKECTFTIGDLDITLSDSKAKMLYNLLLGAFKSSIKKQLESVLTQMAKDILQQNLLALNLA